MKKSWFINDFIFFFCLFSISSSVIEGSNDHNRTAKRILETTGVKGGLIVHINCGDGKLTAALCEGGSYLIHGLDTKVENIEAAREYIRSRDLYGPISVDIYTGEDLPYVDNLVNLIVAEDLSDVPIAEALRVLAPGGTLYARQNGRWQKTVKPWPKEVDEWTHYLHDASGNPVAHDDLIGPPRHLQWTAAPSYTRSHEHIPSLYALVSTGGRIFYIADEASVASVRQTPEWLLVARDAFNGMLLWKKPIDMWFPHIVNWGQTPQQLQRRLVAVNNRVYVTLGLHAPLTAVDATTGDILKVYENTLGADEIILHKGTLLLVIRDVTQKRTDELAKWALLVRQDDSPVYKRETAESLVKQLRSTETRGAETVLALDATTGRLLWKKEGTDTSGLRTNSLCAEGNRVFYQNGGGIVCLDLESGHEQWSVSSGPLRSVCNAMIYCADGKIVAALSAQTGQVRWTQPSTLTDIRDVFVTSDSLWIGGFKPFPTKRGPSWGPYFATQRDPATGKMLMHIEPENPGHHHRCYNNKATDRYILGGRRGTEFIDLKSGEVLWNSWARGVCKYGVMPSNGLLYAPPHACGCYMAAKLIGFNALAAERKTDVGGQKTKRLEKGAGYGEIRWTRDERRGTSQWPTYRCDAQRSGATQATIPIQLRHKWQVKVGRQLSAPVIAEGKVFVASVDEHSITAIDADSGRMAWQFTAGARIDSAPTLYEGRVLFGCRDGVVYCVRASDGRLCWRLRIASDARRIAACGQLESATPVIGSVLIRDGVVHATAGRSSYLDGGIELYRLDAETGKILSQTPIYSPDPETGKQPAHTAPAFVPGARADILTCDDDYIYLRDTVFDKKGAEQKEGKPHLFTLTDFLDGSWPHRSYWIFGTKLSVATGCSGRDRNLIYGRLLVFDESTIYGYGRKQVHWSNQLQDGICRLFAINRGEQKPQWEKRLNIRVRAMLKADDVIFAAGPRAETGVWSIDNEKDAGVVVMAFSASDGSELAQYPLDGSPLFDGMAAAYGRLYISTEDGAVLCLGE
ncbi:MAG: PQQ-binding-like beta-propeller repeat protein [Sedimentisphaerales bacterium]|nr:PQQ-binding-like beta-propeller repeat protein [Sedimentisphaerales bacterium]